MTLDKLTISRQATRAWLYLGLAVLVAACDSSSGQELSQQTPAGRGGGRGGRGRNQGPVPVEIAVAELGDAARFVSSTGTVEPLRTVGVNSQVSGALLEVAVEEGDVVREGQVLAQIDSRELELQLGSAEASLEVARRNAERAQRLYQEKIITAAEHDRDQAAYAASRASHDQIRTRLGYATVRAPSSGVVLDKRVESGDIVGGQTRLFTIGDVSTLVVRVPVSELDVSGLRIGDPVDVTLDAIPGQLLPGRIRRVFPSADSLTRLIPVEVALAGVAARAAKPGFLARVTLRLDPRTNILLVPAPALLEDPAGSIVYLAQAGRAARRRVQRGGTFQGRVEIVDGLAPGDSVIVNGNHMVRDGGEIRVVAAPASEPGLGDAGGRGANGVVPPTGGGR